MKTGEALIGAIDRMQQMVLENPALLARLELLPAEKMLAAIDPGYQALEVAARLDSHLVNGHLHFVQYNADSPSGAGYADALWRICSTICRPVKEFRKKYTLTQGRQPQTSAAGAAEILQAVRRHARSPISPSWNSGPPITPGRANIEFFRDFFREEGYAVEIVSPEQLEYRNGVLRKGKFEIDLIYRRLGVQEFLHPLRSDASAGAGLSRPRGVRGEQLPLGAGAQEGHVRPAHR